MTYSIGDRVKVVGEIKSYYKIDEGETGTILSDGQLLKVGNKPAYLYRVQMADRILYLFEDEMEKETN